MKLVSLQATNRHTKQRQFYKFDLPTTQKKVVTSSSSALDSYLQYCLLPQSTGDFDVEVNFDVDGQSYRLQKTFDGQDYKTQLFATFAHSQTLVQEGDEVFSYVQNHFDVNLADLCNNAYVSNQVLDDFNGQLSCFDNVYQLHMAYNQMPTEEPRQQPQADQQQLQQLTEQLASVDANLLQTRTQLAQIREQSSQNAVEAEVASQLATLYAEQDKLNANASVVEDMRKQLQIRDQLADLVPKMGELEALSQQMQQYQTGYDHALEQLSWQETELQAIAEQLATKQSQTELALDKQNKIEVINQELQTIATLHEANKNANLQLVQLGEQRVLLLADKEIFTNKLVSIQNEIEQCKQRLETLDAPEKSVADLLEGVKIDTKLEEITAQLEILKTELTLKENQLAQKEGNLVVQVRRFRSVAELDVTVSPIKAKDTILQVLDAKYGKLEEINQTLEEKLRNLQRAVEDYRYRITQLDSSKGKLQSQLDQASERKLAQFKREAYLAAQRTIGDPTAAYAVTAQLDDVETQTLRQELSKRTADRDFLVQKASQLEGRIAEIKRHLAINYAEMQSLSHEKGNINDHYNQIVSQNRGEAVFNYLKALESNNGTKYLLDVQQEAVQSQAEITQIKQSVDALRTKIQALEERKARLVGTRSHLNGASQSTVSTNQQIKDDLTVVSDNLSSNYALYQSIRQQLDKTELDLLQVDGKMEQLNAQVQWNEQQIATSTQRATAHAGTDDLQQAVTSLKYQLADAGDEAQMLNESYALTQKEVFKRRIEAEKLQWLLQGATSDYNALHAYVTNQLQSRGMDQQGLNLGAINKHAEQMRQAVAKYDGKLAQITAKISYLKGLIKGDQPQVDDLQAQMQTLIATEQSLLETKQNLQQCYQAQLNALFQGASAPVVATTDKAVRRLVKQRLASFLSTAQASLSAQIPNCTLQMVGDVVQVYKDGSLLSYSQMSNKQKAAVYLALLTSSWQDQTGRWVIIDEIAGVTKAELAQMLSATNVHYVVAYTVINKEKKQ